MDTTLTALTFGAKVAQTLNEAVTGLPSDSDLNIHRVQTSDGIFITLCEGALFVEDYEHGADFEEIDHAEPWSVLKANIEWLRNARGGN